jgi:hypothetical protein
MNRLFRHRFGTLFLLPLILISSCRKEEIVYYEIPKEPVTIDSSRLPESHPPVTEMSKPGMMNASPHATSELTWQKPDGWTDGKPSSMRLGSYAVEGSDADSVDISVTRFPGEVGGLFSNVNRWRGQLGMERLGDPSELGAIRTMDTAYFKFQLVDLVAQTTPARRMQVAILDLDGFTWFFKISGLKEKVDAEDARFEQFVRSVEIGGSGS